MALVVVMFCVTGLPTQAASKPKITKIKAGTETKIQLDGKGNKEKVKLTVKKKWSEPEEEYGGEICSSTVTLTINGKQVLKKTYKTEWEAATVQLVVSDVKTSDKYKDLFLGVYNYDWSGDYLDLVRITYKNGKATKDQLLKTLKAIKSPKLAKDIEHNDMSGRGYMLNPIEACEGLTKGDLKVNGDGTIKWHVCLYTETGVSGKPKKKLTLYKTAGGSKKVVTVAKGKKVKMTQFKFVDKKLYVKIKYGEKTGWVSKSALKAFEWADTLHF